MDSLKMPMREVRAKFTKSEVFIMGWHSSEQAHQMKIRRHKVPSGPNDSSTGLQTSNMGDPYEVAASVNERVLEERLGDSVISRMTTKEGEVDLRKLSGTEALHFMRCMGVNISNRVLQ